MDVKQRIPFTHLTRAVAGMRSEIDAAMAEVTESGWFILGNQCRAFEDEFAAACDAYHAVAVASGTDAIELALRALKIGPGDEVVTQANTCVPTLAAIARTGATPVLCDVEPEAATIGLESLAASMTSRTRAVVPVHLYGQCAEMDAVVDIANRRGAAVVEDCAQAHGAMYRGRHAGTMGAMGCFSFYPTKNLGGLGDAGAVVTNDDALAERVRLLRQYGQTDRYHHVIAGVNSRVDELQAAILRRKLLRLDTWNGRRAEIAATYTNALRQTAVIPLRVLEDRRHAFHLYVVRTGNRATFQSEMERRGVATLIHYPVPLHQHEPYRALGEGQVPLSNAERLCREVVSLPLYPELTDDEVDAVAEASRESAGATA